MIIRFTSAVLFLTYHSFLASHPEIFCAFKRSKNSTVPLLSFEANIMMLTFYKAIIAFLSLIGLINAVPLGIDSKRHEELLQRAEEILDRMPVIDG